MESRDVHQQDLSSRHQATSPEWEAIASIVKKNLTSCAIATFNDFIDRGLPRTIDRFCRLEVENPTESEGSEEGSSEEGSAEKSTPSKYIIEFSNPSFSPPSFSEISGVTVRTFPRMCKMRGISYVSQLYVSVDVTTPLGTHSHFPNVYIGDIPVLVKSKLCNLEKISGDIAQIARNKEDFNEMGGYFIIGGSEKAVSCREKTASNIIVVFANHKKKPYMEYYAEIRSSCPNMHNTTTKIGVCDGELIAVLPYLETHIPVGVLFKALGKKKPQDSEILRYIPGELNDSDKGVISRTMEGAFDVKTKESALYYIGSRTKNFASAPKEFPPSDDHTWSQDDALGTTPAGEEYNARDVIECGRKIVTSELFPHIGTTHEDEHVKKLYLGLILREILDTISGKQPLGDRDHYMNKQIETVGMLFHQLFNNAFGTLVKELKASIIKHLENKHIVNVIGLISSSTITKKMKDALMKNYWGTRGELAGTSQTSDTFNHISKISGLRKCVTPIAQNGGKIVKPRELHGSQWMNMCPAETPEGKGCGLKRNMALAAIISSGTDAIEMIDVVMTLDCIPAREATQDYVESSIPIFVNGKLQAYTLVPEEVVRKLKKMRRNADIHPHTSISLVGVLEGKPKFLLVDTSEGRVMHPSFIVEDGKVLFYEAIRDASAPEPLVLKELYKYVEYLDSREQETTIVAQFPSELDPSSEGYDPRRAARITHCELHPSLMFGIGASLIPFADHNQSPRNCYQAAMGKQAIGYIGTAHMYQTSGKWYTMLHPQKSLVSTRASQILGMDDLPGGQMAMVAVAQYKGYNQEDSLIINADSVDRGFMNVTVNLVFEGKIRRNKGDVFQVPLPGEGSYRGNTSKIPPGECVVPEHTRVQKGDILIGIIEIGANGEKKNKSVVYDQQYEAEVVFVIRGRDFEGNEFIKVHTSELRGVKCGDKFAARHGQKGTAGQLERSINLPCTTRGITPDIIINPNAFPGRMTIAMLIELLVGRKIAATHALNTVTVESCVHYGVSGKTPENPGEEFENDAFSKKVRYHPSKDDGDGTPFNPNFSVGEVCKQLASLGVNGFSEEIMIDGESGEEIESLIYFGPVCYQRLKHMVLNKFHARSRGSRTRLMRQPKEGRGQGGGFRNGTMERDVESAQGATSFLIDRMLDNSDATEVCVCKVCGLRGILKKVSRCLPGDEGSKTEVEYIMECRVCRSNECEMVKMPYATTVVANELLGMNIAIRTLPEGCAEGEDDFIVVPTIVR